MHALPTKILLATDGSREAGLASRAAADLCHRTSAELHVVHVWTNLLSKIYPTLALEEHSDAFERGARVLLEEQADKVRSGEVFVAGTHLKEGRIAEEIVGLAENLDVGLVVLGGRGVNPIGRLVTREASPRAWPASRPLRSCWFGAGRGPGRPAGSSSAMIPRRRPRGPGPWPRAWAGCSAPGLLVRVHLPPAGS